MAGEHDWRQDGPYHWRCARCGQREQQRERAKDCAPSPDPAALWALVRRWDARAADATDDVADAVTDCGLELSALLPPETP